MAFKEIEVGNQNQKLLIPTSVMVAAVATQALAPQPTKEVRDKDFDIEEAEIVANVEVVPYQQKTVIAVIPACNEEQTIVATVQSLLDQDRAPDGVVVVVNNSTDRTEEMVRDNFPDTQVRLLVMDKNPDKKVGALRHAWMALQGSGIDFDYLLGVDGDTILSPNSLGDLLEEMERDSKLGGLSARYTFDPSLGRTRVERLLIRMQRLEFASSGLDTMYRKRNTYVLGGQATLFRVKAMMEVSDHENLHSPWDPDDDVEDMGLTWNMKEQGWLTKVSATARAYAGPMFTVRTLYNQRRKWDGGTLKLLFRTKPWVAGQVWGLQARNFLDVTVRVMFAFLLTISLVLGIYHWSWWWLVPPAVAILLNYKIARKVPNRTFLDTVLSVLLMPVEIYLVFRLFVWTISLLRTITGSRKDGWAAQYMAEQRSRR